MQHSAARSAETRANGEKRAGGKGWRDGWSSTNGGHRRAGTHVGLLQVAAAVTMLLGRSERVCVCVCVSVCVLFVRDGSMPTGARLSSHTGLLCAYQLVIRRRAPWDLLLIQQGCPGTGPHPVIRRPSAFLHSLTPCSIISLRGFTIISREALQ